jgi:integrase
VGPSYRRQEPHIYSDSEISALLGAAAKLPPVDGLRPKTFTCLYGLLACTGLRIAEALRLKRPHADLTTGVLAIVETKFSNSRLVPLHPSATRALKAYAEMRDCFFPLANAQEFFLTDPGIPLTYKAVRQAFAELRDSLGWVRAAKGRPPRIHDLRHTFACRRLLAWYQEGADVDLKVPALSTYLGHVGVSSTYWYFTAVPDLMAAAAARFERTAQTPR